jgi:centrosomal protein CEP290
LKTKIKELSEEVVLFQKRLQESSHLGSENEDSPDALSEIDKQQELMSNITMKNKHIKRLLRDIEDLEKRSTKQVNLIQELRFNLNDSTQNVVTLSNQLTESKGNNKQLEDEVSKLNNIILELEEQNKQLKKEKEERQFELESFSKELQKRIDSYQKILYDKQEELNAANQRYHDLIANIPGYKAESESSDEYKNMVESIKDRDSIIKNLEKKISQLTNELFDSTNVIKKFNEEKDEYVNRLLRNKNEQCCKEEKIMLEKSHERCKELQDMLTFIEDDNLLKSKQAFEAIEALRSYENNEDGLSVALKKIHQLQESLHRKDKQIQELVHELNSANEVAAENYILRKKLGIPEDEIIHTKSFFAKQRKFAKINERLLLKLQASEEMRLQLKIDKNDLRRKIAKLKEQLAGRQPTTQSGSESENQDQQSTHESEENFSRGNILKRDSSTIQLCENCQSQYSMLESIKFCRGCIAKQNMELVKKIQKLEVDHKNVMEENDNLRLGMQEILEKLRDYEGKRISIVLFD